MPAPSTLDGWPGRARRRLPPRPPSRSPRWWPVGPRCPGPAWTTRPSRSGRARRAVVDSEAAMTMTAQTPATRQRRADHRRADSRRAPAPGRPTSWRPTTTGGDGTGPGRQAAQPRVPHPGDDTTRPGVGRRRRPSSRPGRPAPLRRRQGAPGQRRRPGPARPGGRRPAGRAVRARRLRTASDRAPGTAVDDHRQGHAAAARWDRVRPRASRASSTPAEPSICRATAWVSTTRARHPGHEGEHHQADDDDVDRRGHPVEELVLDAAGPDLARLGRGPTAWPRSSPGWSAHPRRS